MQFFRVLCIFVTEKGVVQLRGLTLCGVLFFIALFCSGCGADKVIPMAVPQVSCTPGAGAVPQGATVTVTAATNSVLPVTLSFSSSAGQLAVNGNTAVLSTAGISPGTVTVGCKATDNQGQSSQASAAV